MDKTADLLQGTLDMLILKAISLGPLHGYGILQRIQQISDGSWKSSRAPSTALYRLEQQGLIDSEWGESDNKRKARYHPRSTATGSRQLQESAPAAKVEL